MSELEIEQFYPETKQHWRKWLEKNHIRKDAVWLVFYNKKSTKPTISWSDAVDEALCFGWIDSKAETLDTESHRHYFCKRKPNSTWSKINKEKIERLTSTNQMTQAGFEVIEIAKKNGSWTILDTVEALIVPVELENEFIKFDGSKDYFSSLSKSNKKILLQWIALAKTETTKQKRIVEIVENASQKQLPKLFRRKKNGI
ncbi:uncharacterized protein YdeI (YjbR/CyaY-like superfamily) [Algoriphagus sp. 4150]|uniref:YdeI/OmpD-associated family protein n=1 Tax=Algoriphagus sp. 4150 TaxID=2817756 RepID=UPI0028545F56|nr:YdeI/OmpD-associated family protein [Algoriphagus sp. 4150]MDR7129747.1 uncharacterized protein YdeI (YjbR/CyaY-like superfamily) [Algoriphagus sp. 4150]